MKFFKTLLTVMLANVVLFVVVVGIVALVSASMSAQKPDIDDGSYLVIDIYGDVMAYDPPQTVPGKVLGGDTETLHRILENLEKAAADDRIAGVVVKISSNNGLGYAMIEEIREAVAGVQAAGKPVIAYGDYLDRKSLFLASACDSIFIPEVGEVWLTGMATVRGFLKGTLDMLDIEPNIDRIREYKSAAEPVLRKNMSEESKEMAGWMLDEMWDMQVPVIAADRGMTTEAMTACMETIMFPADEAMEAGLIDGMIYWSDLTERLKGDAEEFESVTQAEYAKVTRKDVGLDGDRTIAVIHAHGLIGGRKSRVDPMLGVVMGHETVAGQLRAAAEDDDVAAIVFRVDSGGGESLASDIIGHEVQRAAAVKPVIVSMVDVAASGGYSISYRATKLVADPMTITGSIGSISGKFNMAGMWNKAGVTFDSVTKGPNGLFSSSVHNYTDEQWKLYKENHWKGVKHWMLDIAAHRGMTFEELEPLAYGRVWSGRQAKENGLIDETGGLSRALAVAREEAGIDADEPVTLEHYPRQKSLFQLITGGDSGSSAAAWVAYRFIHHDLPETLALLTGGRMDVLPWRTAN